MNSSSRNSATTTITTSPNYELHFIRKVRNGLVCVLTMAVVLNQKWKRINGKHATNKGYYNTALEKVVWGCVGWMEQ